MDDLELLIMHVRERPCLYDMRHANYKRTDVKDNNWEEIAKDLNVTCKIKNSKL